MSKACRAQTDVLPSAIDDAQALSSLNGFQSFFSSLVHPGERVPSWLAWMARSVGADHNDKPARCKFSFVSSQPAFDGRIHQFCLGKVHVSKVAASAHGLEMALADSGHRRPHVLIVLQCKGTSVLAHDGVPLELRAGELAALSIQRELRIVNQTNVEQYFIWFDEPRHALKFAKGMTSHRRCVPAPMQRLACSFIERLFHEPDLCHAESGPFLATAMIKLLHLAFKETHVAKPQKVEPNRPSREMVVQYVESNLRDPELSPEIIARALGWSKRTVYRAFKGDSGESLNAYLWRRRIEQCAQELRGPSNLSITCIAYSFGFSSGPHFSRLFKQHMGASPLRYRRQCSTVTTPCFSGRERSRTVAL